MKKMQILFLLVSSLMSQISFDGEPRHLKDNWMSRSLYVTESVDYNAYDLQIKNDPSIRYLVFGYEHDVEINFFDDASKFEDSSGTTYLLDIVSESAYSMSFKYKNFFLPYNSEMYIYSTENNSYIGKFTDFNNSKDGYFATQLLRGDKHTIEVFVPKNASTIPSMTIETVVHDYTDVLPSIDGSTDRVDCNANVSCPSGDGYADQINSVVNMSMGGGFCSASLVNNTANDFTPYILTADHCISGNASQYIFYFNYQSSTCFGTSGPQNQTMSGSSLLLQNSGPDFALLRLNNDVPESYNPFFTGWNKSSATPSDAFGVHHPNAGIKKITLDNSNVVAGGSGSNYWEFEYYDGRVIPGSSGSPMFDQNRRQVGIASYIYIGDYCDPSPDCYCAMDLYSHGYGRLDRAFNYGVGDYLDPTGSGVSFVNGTALSGLSISHSMLDDMPYSQSGIDVSASINVFSGNISYVTLNFNFGSGWSSVPMTTVGVGNLYSGTIQNVQDGSLVYYYIEAGNSEGDVAQYPSNGDSTDLFFVYGNLPVVIEDSFELNDQGWTVGDSDDSATAGIWEWGNPNSTTYNGSQVQPGDDHTPSSGVNCFVTGNGNDPSNVGFDDIDGGKTTLFSPTYDMSSMDDALVSYYRWYTNNVGDNPGTDIWSVSVSNDNGQSWTSLENISESSASWIKKRFLVSDYVELSSSMKFRFIAEDSFNNGDYGTGGSLVEAALDDFLVQSTSSTVNLSGDVNLDGIVNILDVVILINIVVGLDQSSNYPTSDINGDGIIDVLDIVLAVNIIVGAG